MIQILLVGSTNENRELVRVLLEYSLTLMELYGLYPYIGLCKEWDLAVGSCVYYDGTVLLYSLPTVHDGGPQNHSLLLVHV